MEARDDPQARRAAIRRWRLGGRGGLSLSLLVRLRDLGLAMPQGSILLSPWTDLTVSGASVDGNVGKDLWFTRKHLETWASYYVGDADRHSPYVSPVFADLS